MKKIRKKIREDFPGLYTVISPYLQKRIMELVEIYELTEQELTSLLSLLTILDETEAADFLDEIEEKLILKNDY